MPPAANGWTGGFSWFGGVIRITEGTGYLSSIGATTKYPGKHGGARVSKSVGNPITTGKVTHYALMYICKQNSIPGAYVALELWDGSSWGRLSFKSDGSIGRLSTGTGATASEKIEFAVDAPSMGWFAAEMTLDLGTAGAGDETLSVRWRDVDDKAPRYIGDWSDPVSTSTGVIPRVTAAGFFIADFNNPVEEAVGFVDNINVPIR